MRKSRVILFGLVFSFLLVTGLVQAPPAVAQPALLPPDGYAQQVLGLLVDARRAAGLADPQLDLLLVDLASRRSADMASRNYFSHLAPEGTNVFDLLDTSGATWWFAGEIIARNNYGPEQTAAVAAQAYLSSPPHRAVIMDGQYNYMGIGHGVDGQGMHYYTVLFVRR